MLSFLPLSCTLLPGSVYNSFLSTGHFIYIAIQNQTYNMTHLALYMSGLTLSKLGPVVQSVVSLTRSLRLIWLTVLADSIYNILIFFAEKM